MWNVTAKVTQETIRAIGTISKSLRQYLSHIPGKHEIKELQKTALIGHCTHTTENSDVKIQNIYRIYNFTCNSNCKYRTAATLYTVETWFVSGI